MTEKNYHTSAINRALKLIQPIGGISNGIAMWDRMLSGRASIGKSALALAQYEGRDYFAELRERRRLAILRRFELASEAAELGITMKWMPEYQSRATEAAL